MIREFVHISGSQPGEKVSEQDQLLLISGDPSFGYVMYNPHNRTVNEWRMWGMPSEAFNSGDTYFSLIQSDQRLANWNQPVRVISFTGRQSMVPEQIYESSGASLFAALQFVHTHEDHVLSDVNPFSKSVGIYAQPKELTQVLNRFFPLRKEGHYFNLLLNQEAVEDPLLTLSVFPSQCILTAQMNRQWHLMQTYSFESGEDVLYLLLQVIQQLGQEPASVKVQLEGLIDAHSSLTSLLEQYLPQIQWGRPLAYRYPATSDFQDHAFSLIDRILTCVS